MKIGDRVFRAVLDTGATLSIVARRLLKTFRKTKTVAIRVGDGRTIHSLGGVDVTICLGDETVTQHCRVLDTDTFDIVIGTDFLRRNPQVKMLSLQRPYSLHCDFGSGLFSVPLELSGRKESGLRYAAKTNYRTENYQLARHVLENGLAALQVNESAALGRGWCRRAQGRQDQGGRHARSRPERCCWGQNRIHGHQRRQERRQRRQDPC